MCPHCATSPDAQAHIHVRGTHSTSSRVTSADYAGRTVRDRKKEGKEIKEKAATNGKERQRRGPSLIAIVVKKKKEYEREERVGTRLENRESRKAATGDSIF